MVGDPFDDELGSGLLRVPRLSPPLSGDLGGGEVFYPETAHRDPSPVQVEKYFAQPVYQQRFHVFARGCDGIRSPGLDLLHIDGDGLERQGGVLEHLLPRTAPCAEANVRRNAGFVQAARLSGNGEFRILLVHILPNIMPIMIVQMSLTMGYAILNAAGLSFIGLGVRPPAPEWGIMVAEGANFIQSGEWWIALFPGAALMLAVFCFNLLGDGLRDIIDPLKRT